MIIFISLFNCTKNHLLNENMSPYSTLENDCKTFDYQEGNESHVVPKTDLLKHSENIILLNQQFFINLSFYNELIKKNLSFNLRKKFFYYIFILKKNEWNVLLKLDTQVYKALMPILNFVLESLCDLKHSILNLNIKNINCNYYIVIIDFITDILQLCNIDNSDISVFFLNPKIVFIKYLELNVNFNTAFKKINILFLFNLFQDSLLFEIQLANSDYSYLSVTMETIKAHIYLLCEKETYISERISRILKVFIVK